MKKEKSLKLDPLRFALAAAMIAASTIFLITSIAILNVFGTLPALTLIISDFYGSFGYSVSLLGAFLGALYSFIDTFIMVYIFVWLYNKML